MESPQLSRGRSDQEKLSPKTRIFTRGAPIPGERTRRRGILERFAKLLERLGSAAGEKDQRALRREEELRRVSEELGIPPRIRARAGRLLEKLEEGVIVQGKRPRSIAAGTIYAASVAEGGELTQEEVAGAAGVSEVTLRNR